jgi:predicted nucleic acid-binding protein
MRVVDTSAWIEWLTGSALGASLAAELPATAQWVVPTIVQLELAKWLTRECGEDKADRVIAFTVTCVVAGLDTATALSAADLCARHKLATADAIVYATALAHDADLLTCDQHFAQFPGVRIFCQVWRVRTQTVPTTERAVRALTDVKNSGRAIP